MHLFKAGVEGPLAIHDLSDLTFPVIDEQVDGANIEPQLLLKKQTMRLFQMVWSGVTKNLESMVQRNRGVEYPSLGVFMPVELEESNQDHEAASAKLTRRALDTISKKDTPVQTRLLVNETFLGQVQGTRISAGHWMSSYDPLDSESFK